MAPLWNFNLRFSTFYKATSGKHGPEVLALSYEDGLMRIDALALHNKSDVAELAAFQQPAHVLDERVHCHIVQCTFLEAANVQHVKVIEPLVAIEAAENVDPF